MERVEGRETLDGVFPMIPGRQWPFNCWRSSVRFGAGRCEAFCGQCGSCSLASRAGSILLLLLLVKNISFFRHLKSPSVPYASFANYS